MSEEFLYILKAGPAGGRLRRPSSRRQLLYSEDIARLISELIDATTDADPAWRDQVLGLIRLALDLKRDER